MDKTEPVFAIAHRPLPIAHFIQARLLSERLLDVVDQILSVFDPC